MSDLTSPTVDWPMQEASDFLTNLEYDALLHLYNEYNAAFDALPEYMRQAFFIRLRNRG